MTLDNNHLLGNNIIAIIEPYDNIDPGVDYIDVIYGEIV